MPTWLRQRLLNGDRVVGTFVQTPHPAVCEVLGSLGWDAVCLDCEHSAIGLGEVESLVRAADVSGVACLARVSAANATEIARALDAGAAGVIVPCVNTAPEAAAAVRAARFPPAGARGVGPGRAAAYGGDIPRYLEDARLETLVAVQVETRSSVESLDAILGVDGVDLIFVGPADLGLSLGLERAATELREQIEDVLDRARRAGRLTGIFCTGSEDPLASLAADVDLVLVGSDLLFLSEAAAAARARFGAADTSVRGARE